MRTVHLIALSMLAASSATAQDRPAGITEPTVFAAFDPSAPACTPPPGLTKSLGFAKDNDRDFMDGVDQGLRKAAADRGLQYRVSVANNDAAKNAEQVRAFRAENYGALVAAPVDSPSLAESLQENMWAGAYVGSIVAPPATSLLNAPQYLTGKTLADEAAAYIRAHFNKTSVVLLTHDSLEFVAPRFAAMRDVLENMPEVTIVADISPLTVDMDGGYATMRTILEAHPTVDVVLGADTVVMGALSALRAAGKARPDQFLGGIDGEPGAVAEIEKADSPYKVSVSLASPVFGYAMGQHAADWLDGKSVPQALDVLPVALTRDNLGSYRADLADPGAVYADPKRRAAYLKFYGNVCYDTRERYVNFPWSSEAK
jgi:ribose transport system substrate-binding protein